MVKQINVVAKDETTAFNEAVQILSRELKREVGVEEIELLQVNEKSGFMGFGKKNEYVFQLNLSEEDTAAKAAAEAAAISAAENSVLDFIKAPEADGYFQVKVLPRGVFLRVVAPKAQGRWVTLQAVKQVLDAKQIVGVDFQAVEQALKEGTSELVKIAERKPELDRDADLQVTIAPEGMQAWCTYQPPLGGNQLTLIQAMRLLNSKGIQYGIDEKKLDWVLKENVKQEILVASGTAPEHGKAAELRYHFQLPGEQKHVKELEDGSVDYYNLDLVTNVHAGDLLVTKIPATLGIPGRSVAGTEIKPEPGKDVRLPKGKNVDVGADEMSLFASMDGQVHIEEDKISVLPIFVVNGDVDLETGNITFIGNVIIKGNIQEGFSVKAEGDVEVSGNVGGATIEAGGRVLVRKGFQGKQKGLIKAENDVHIGFIENGQVVTRGSLFVRGAIMHSEIVAKVDVVVEGRGLIVGGSVQAGNDVVAKIIGSHLATPTDVMAGVDPEVRQQLEQVNEEIERANENMDKVLKGLEQLRKLEKQMGGRLSGDKSGMADQFDTTRNHLQEQLNQLIEQRELLTKQLREQKNGRIKASDRVYPGVKIYIGQAGYRVKDALARTAFVYDEGEVRTRPL